MKAPGPPPTIPSRRRRFIASVPFGFAVMILVPSHSSNTSKKYAPSLSALCPAPAPTRPGRSLQTLCHSSARLKSFQTIQGYFLDATLVLTSADSPVDPRLNLRSHQKCCPQPE